MTEFLSLPPEIHGMRRKSEEQGALNLTGPAADHSASSARVPCIVLLLNSQPSTQYIQNTQSWRAQRSLSPTRRGERSTRKPSRWGGWLSSEKWTMMAREIAL